MDLIDAGPLRSCSNGGRKVYMLFESQIAEDVEPIFLLYDQNGRRLDEMDHILTQPNDLRYPNVKKYGCYEGNAHLNHSSPTKYRNDNEEWMVNQIGC